MDLANPDKMEPPALNTNGACESQDLSMSNVPSATFIVKGLGFLSPVAINVHVTGKTR